MSAGLWERQFEGDQGRGAGALGSYRNGKPLRGAGDWERTLWSGRRKYAGAGEGRTGAEALQGGRTAGLVAG